MRLSINLLCALCLTLTGLGCVFNAEVVTLSKMATYDRVDWHTFRSALDDGSITVFGHDDPRMELTARIEAVVLHGEEASAREGILVDLVARNQVLQMALDCPDDLEETVQVRSIQAVAPRTAWLDLETGNSSIAVFGMEGNVVAETSNGDITAQTDGMVSLRTSNGRIDLDTGDGGRADTSNGEIFATVRSGEIVSLRLSSSNGSIFVYLPIDAGFQLDLETSNGEIDLSWLGFGVNGDSFFGPIRGGGPLIRVRTSNGDIKIR
ncbi:MAG: DUF4097 family beta strand repeat protein [Bradymonadales bacterium]|nr:DUF4097 family beta strand repeat protein [Bradymonadales bacterium]